MLGVINVRDKRSNNLSKVYGVRRSLASSSSIPDREDGAVASGLKKRLLCVAETFQKPALYGE